MADRPEVEAVVEELVVAGMDPKDAARHAAELAKEWDVIVEDSK